MKIDSILNKTLIQQSSFSSSSQKKKKDNPEHPSKEKKQTIEEEVKDFEQEIKKKDCPLEIIQIQDPSGLKILLKHRNGVLIREMTAEQFLQLKESARSEKPSERILRGIIIDQKL